MRAGPGRLNAATAQRALNHLADGLAVHGPGGLGKQKYLTVRTSWTTRAQISCHRLPHLGQQWQLCRAAILAVADSQGGRSPMDILQQKPGDFTGPQTQSRQTQADGPITPPLSGPPIPTGQQRLQLRPAQIKGQVVVCATGDLGNRPLQGLLEPTALLRKPQEIAHGAGDIAQRGGLIIRAPGGQIAHQINRGQIRQIADATDVNRFQETADVSESVPAGLGRQTHHLLQVLLIRLENFMRIFRRMCFHPHILPRTARSQRPSDVPVEITHNYVELKPLKSPFCRPFSLQLHIILNST